MKHRLILAFAIAGAILVPAVPAQEKDDPDVLLLQQSKVKCDDEGLLAFFNNERFPMRNARRSINSLPISTATSSKAAPAQLALEDIGLLARPMLAEALKSDSPEVRLRARRALRKSGRQPRKAV